MSVTYAIPDLHGRIDLLEAALEQIDTHASGRASKIVTLGDYVDRGPDSRWVIEKLMSWRSDNLELVALKGNHEAMMWDTCNNLADLDWWIINGGDQTLRSYGSPEGDDVRAVPAEHLHWIAGLPLMHIDRQRVFVHAAVDPAVSLHHQSEQTLLWKRYPSHSDSGHGNRHVVHGHNATAMAPVATSHKTNLDAMAWKTGRLIVGVFEDDKAGGASEFLEILGRATQ
jgi:serine/threonine protein phosphatase 1